MGAEPYVHQEIAAEPYDLFMNVWFSSWVNLTGIIVWAGNSVGYAGAGVAIGAGIAAPGYLGYGVASQYDYAGQVYPAAVPYIHEEYAAEPYVHQEIAAEPYVHEEIAAEPYIDVQIPAEPYIHIEPVAAPLIAAAPAIAA